MLISTAFCGVIFSLFSGQPLIIIGATGPVVVFEEVLYKVSAESPIHCHSNKLHIVGHLIRHIRHLSSSLSIDPIANHVVLFVTD